MIVDLLSALRLVFTAAALAATPALPAPVKEPAAEDAGVKEPAADVVLSALDTELQRSLGALRSAENVPLYYLSYGVADITSAYFRASLGALDDNMDSRQRLLDVDARVGSPKLDNTHELKGKDSWMNFREQRGVALPIEDDLGALRSALWYETDRAFKDALKRFAQVKTNRATTAEEEDPSDDFSTGEPVQLYFEKAAFPALDRGKARARVKALSLLFKGHSFIQQSNVTMSVEVQNRSFASSEGTKIRTGLSFVRLSYELATTTQDGMTLRRSKSYDSNALSDLPSDEAVRKDIDQSIAELKALRTAPVVEPYSGPVIMRGRAAAVFFHEIFGHRIEGQRQKSEAEGQTFTKKLGERIMPEFLSVRDDPTVERFGGQFLRGFYRFDDQGVKAQKVNLVDHGVLKNFLMYRSPVNAFARSNGHGRREPGFPAVARQGNLLVEAELGKTVSYQKLRELLIEEIKKQKKPYGLIFDDIQGGFTMTRRWGVQSYKVHPLLVYRVFADGRPDEAVRGVDMVGTPLSSFGRILAAADDPSVFNGSCGAESGWVPVSAVSPSLLISEIEVEKVAKSQEKPPMLPPPSEAAMAAGSGDPIFGALRDEMARSLSKLKLDEHNDPYYAAFTARDVSRYFIRADFGAISETHAYPYRQIKADLRVGGPQFDSAHFVGRDYWNYKPIAVWTTYEADYGALRHTAWAMTDRAYKQSLDRLAQKQAYKEAKAITDQIDDLSPEPKREIFEPLTKQKLDMAAWSTRARALNSVFKGKPALQRGLVEVFWVDRASRFVNSEGTSFARNDDLFQLDMRLTTQAEDGMDLSDKRTFIYRSLKDVPKQQELLKEAGRFAQEMTALVTASSVTHYTGPVLMEGQASAEFFNQLLAHNISFPRALWVEDESQQRLFESGSLTRRLDQRITARFISAIDDPSLKSWQERPLIGYYPVDDEGVPPKAIAVIEKGILKDFPTNRSPTKERTKSNGHGRGAYNEFPAGRISNLVIRSEKKAPLAELKKKLIKDAQELGLEFALIVRRMSPESRQDGDELLSPPTLVYQLFPDGSEKLLRGMQFTGTSLRALRDIVLASEETVVHNFEQLGPALENRGSVPASIVAPSVLVQELELKLTARKPTRLPYLPAP